MGEGDDIEDIGDAPSPVPAPSFAGDSGSPIPSEAGIMEEGDDEEDTGDDPAFDDEEDHAQPDFVFSVKVFAFSCARVWVCVCVSVTKGMNVRVLPPATSG
jgi:hypothetical protein